MNSLILLSVIIVIVFIFFLFLRKAKSPERKGEYGESIVAAAVASSIHKGLYGHVLRNVYVPRNDGSSSEVDVIFVCVKGIFVFESKNYVGYIFGNDQYRNWTVSLYAGKNLVGFKTTEKHNFYNPVWQNRTHIRALQSIIKTTAPFISIIVFSNRSELKNITYDASKVTILKSNQLRHFMRDIQTNYSDVLPEYDVDNIANNLAQYVGADDSVKRAHLESIRRKAEEPEICPWCGSKLVIRTAKKGPNEGNHFYGCSQYPKCRYIRNIH